MAKKRSSYYDDFVTMIGFSRRSAETLQGVLRQFQVEDLPEKRKEMHQMEHQADTEKHNMMEKLAREFLPPIEREDIIELAQAIDDVTDQVEDVLLRIYMYHLQNIRPESLQFVDLIVQCCCHLEQALVEFHNFRKSTHIHEHVVEVNSLEEDGDQLYVDSVHQLYGEPGEPAVKIGWVRTFDCMEECCDACEHVANLVERIIMKNT